MSNATRPRVLIVDDERLLVDSLGELLSDDFDVVSARTVAEGIEYLRSATAGGERIDAVLCDLHLDDGTGLDLYRACREVAAGSERRIVFYTGGNVPAAIATQLAATGNPCLNKPFDFDAMTALLQRIAAG